LQLQRHCQKREVTFITGMLGKREVTFITGMLGLLVHYMSCHFTNYFPVIVYFDIFAVC